MLHHAGRHAITRTRLTGQLAQRVDHGSQPFRVVFERTLVCVQILGELGFVTVADWLIGFDSLDRVVDVVAETTQDATVCVVLSAHTRRSTGSCEAFTYAQAINLDTYARQRDRLREEFMLTQINEHSIKPDKFDIEGIVAFAERVLT